MTLTGDAAEQGVGGDCCCYYITLMADAAEEHKAGKCQQLNHVGGS